MVTKAAPKVQPRNPYMDGSGKWGPPDLNNALRYSTIGSSGLRQFSGWVREEFLPQLQGRQAARTYREMLDNSPTIGAVNFAIVQSMRQVEWRVVASSDKPEAQEAVEFVESCMDDMSSTWTDFTMEQLSMLGYGFAPHEIVYKRRTGKRSQKTQPDGSRPATSKYDDGLVGWRKIPLRGQDTVIKWFFASDGATTGMTQQPWVGGLIDIPIEKLLLFRPSSHKGNPEGRSILRNSYRAWYFVKRIEEQEAIMFERFSGLPKITVPSQLLEAAQANDANAMAALESYKNIGRNVRIDDQMCVVFPSDTYRNPDGTMSAIKMYDIEFASPASGRATVTADVSIERYKLDMMTSTLADFLSLGHTSRGAQNLAETKVDLFFQATEGYIQSNADVMNRYALPRLWALNGMDEELMPRFEPDMPQRIDLDGLSNFVLRLSQAGMPIFPSPEVQSYLLDAAGMPDVTDEGAGELLADYADPDNPPADPKATTPAAQGADQVQKMLAASIARRLVRHGYLPELLNKKRSGGTAKRKKRPVIRV